MSDHQVRPALTPEEWAAAYARETDASLGFHPLHTELVAAADFGRYAQAVALANAALPDGDERKITRDDARAIDFLAGTIDAQHPGGLNAIRRCREIAAKLRALFPPEPPPLPPQDIADAADRLGKLHGV